MLDVIGGIVSSFFGGGGGVHVDFDAVEGAMGQIMQQNSIVQDDVFGPIQDVANNVDEFIQGEVGVQLQDYLDSKLLPDVNGVMDGLTNFHGSLGSALNAMKQGDDDVLSAVLGFAADPIGSILDSIF